jgi:hypothetical protein
LEQPDPEWLLALRKEDEEEEQLKKVNEWVIDGIV